MNHLSPDRWKQVDTLFADALDRPPDERLAFLRHACGHDVALYHEVTRLLDAVDDAGRVLGESVLEFAAPLIPELDTHLMQSEDADAVPKTVGPYRLLNPIGRGGMGMVYLAARADGLYRREVALKLVHPGLATEEMLGRFRHERQILARLEHPGIARLYDGGVAGNGRPYLAMEYVEGIPIDAYCDARRLDVEARLRLFANVCQAVQYAHQNLVVHRDLKPSNILVTENGAVKLLDFGIAKLLPSGADAVPATRPSQRVMTPEYAAPEQVKGETITTATDVYGLGVVLYELLTGQRPFDAANGPHEAQRMLLEQLPGRPSLLAVSTAAATARNTRPARLRRRLRGDLDTILLTALRKEPARRYPSAAALLDDIQRHLNGLPIAARPDTMGYRLRKFAGRHRSGVTTALGLVLLLVGLVTFHTVRLTQARDQAEQHAARAVAAIAFLEDLFEGADPDHTMGDTLTVFELLDRGALLAREELQAPPSVQATTLDILGTLFLKLGDYTRAGPLLERAAVLHLPSDEALARTRINLAHFYAKTGDYAAADSLFRAALALPGVPPETIVDALIDFGTVLEQIGRYEEAEAHLQQALARLPALPGDARTRRANAQYALATVRLNEGQYATADTLLRDVLATRRALYGPRHSTVADVLNNLGNLRYDAGDYDEAEPLLREALTIRRALFGPDHPAVSEALNNLALVPFARGDYVAADSLLRASLYIAERHVGRAHRDVGMTLNNLGWVQLRQNDLDSAEATFREALDIMQHASGAVSADAALLLGNVGVALQEQGDDAAAEPFFREALAVRTQVHGPENMHVAWRQFALAEVLRRLGRYAEAEDLHRTSVAIRRALRPAGHYDIARGLGGLCGVLIDRARYEAAEPECVASFTGFREASGAQHAQTRAAAERLVTLYHTWGQPEHAAAYEALLAAPPP